MSANTLDPDMERLFSAREQWMSTQPDLMAVSLNEARLIYARSFERCNDLDPSATSIERCLIPLPDAAPFAARALPTLRLRHSASWRPEAGTLVYLHGGGWVFGSADTHLAVLDGLAQATGCEVVAFDYSLAPEHLFPAGLDDCLAGWRWLRAHASPSQANTPWVIAGDSAGAQLALVVMQSLRDTKEVLPDAALLFYGTYTANFGTSSHLDYGQGGWGLTTQRQQWFRDQYTCGLSDESAGDPRLFPLTNGLQGLPPIWVASAQFDPLLDDSTQLCDGLRGAGADFHAKTYPGVVHGFLQWGQQLPMAVRAFRDAAHFLVKADSADLRIPHSPT